MRRLTSKCFRADLISGEPQIVLDRLRALEASADRANGAMPTRIPGLAGDPAEAARRQLRPAPSGWWTMIGQGGMGTVWLGERADGLYEQTVAIKLIQPGAILRASKAFDDERRFLARLEHPNIARLIDGGVADGGLPWLAMEFVDGQPIDLACAGAHGVRSYGPVRQGGGRRAVCAWPAGGPRRPQAWQHFRHRRRAGETARLRHLRTDWRGGAPDGPRPRDPGVRQSGAPRRWWAERSRDDIFALGKIAWPCLWPESRIEELAAIAAKASAPDQADRYGSVAELIADLDRWRAKLPVTAIPATWRYAGAKFFERHRALTIATGAVIVLLSATSILASLNFVRAERERGLAEQRFGAVRHLSGYVLFDIYDDLARQPGTVARRVAIAKTASDYLEKLSVSREAPADLRLETARSYRRLAAIQGMAGTPNIGQPAAAGRSLDHAEQILRTLIADDPRSAAAQAEMGWVLADRWTLLGDKDPGSTRMNAAARGAFDQALALDPNSLEALLGVLTSEKSRAHELIWIANKPAQALPVAKAALLRLRGASWPPALKYRANLLQFSLLNRIGDATYYAGDVPGSLQPYQEADALLDRLIVEQGETPQLLTMKADAAFNVSGTLGEMHGREPEALAIAPGGGARPLVAILRAGPDAAAEKSLLVLYGQQATVLEGMGQFEAALVPSAASVELRRRRAAASPGDPRRMRDVSVGLTQHAVMLAKAGRKADACSAASEAVGAWSALKAAGQMGAHDEAKNLPQRRAIARRQLPALNGRHHRAEKNFTKSGPLCRPTPPFLMRSRNGEKGLGMKIDRKSFAAAMALSLGLVTIHSAAHAELAVIYGPRAEANASSGATQGPGFGVASAQIINGVQTAPVASPGGTSATTSTATTNGSAATSQSGGFNGSVLNTSAFASANLATGVLKASVASSGPNTFNSPTGAASARIDDTIFFTNTTSGYVTLDFTYRFDGTIHDTNAGTAQGGSDPSGVANLTFSCAFFYCYNADGQSIRFASGPQNIADGGMEAHFDENGISGFGENIFQSLPPGQQTNFFTQSDHAYGSGGDISGLISASFLIPPGETSLGFRGLLNLDCRRRQQLLTSLAIPVSSASAPCPRG